MALTGLHTDWEYGSYLNDRDWFIKVKENALLANGTDLSGLHPHFDGRTDGRGSIAIGYGFDLLVNDNTTMNNSGNSGDINSGDITLTHFFHFPKINPIIFGTISLAVLPTSSVGPTHEGQP
jgi:hypothetical protein